MDQWNSIEINSSFYVHLGVDQSMEDNTERSLFNKWFQPDIPMQNNEIRPLSYTTHENQVRQIKDLKIRLKTKVIREKYGTIST